MDSGTVCQILSNLILNSITHAYEPGQKGTINITATLKDGHIQLEYSDDGKGIPEEDIKKIIDPFFFSLRGHGGTALDSVLCTTPYPESYRERFGSKAK